jgi:hypothetical protein
MAGLADRWGERCASGSSAEGVGALLAEFRALAAGQHG